MTNPQKTATETAFSEQFAGLRKQSAFSENKQKTGFLPALAERESALEQFEQNGLPTRQIERWHYTDLRRYLTHIAPFAEKAESAALPPLLKEAHILALINGKAQQVKALKCDSINAVALAENADSGMDFAVIEAEEKRDKGDIIGTLNTVFARDGWHVNVLGGSDKMHIIELQNIQNGGQSHSRLPVYIGKNARVTVIERQNGDNQESFLTFVSQLQLAEGAEVNWIILRERGLSSTELNRLSALLGEKSRLMLYVINTGGQFLRQEINVDLAGEEANFQLRGINLLSGKSHTDTTMVVRHLVENTASTEIFRNVVSEEARGIFQGMIHVAQIAQKTDARMACNSLILSDKAEFSAKPELEIFADDVACGHGATVAEINHDHLFYLMARGIPAGKARALLVKAFIGELIEELPSALAKNLYKALETWLQAHFRAA